MMSYILNREVEEGEIFENEIEYNVWRTSHGVVDLDASFRTIVEEYNYNRYVFDINSQDTADTLDAYFFDYYNELAPIAF